VSWSALGPAGAARLAVLASVVAAVALQAHSGLWSQHGWDLLVGVGALAGAAAAPVVLREGRGLLPALGMTAVAVAHAFVTAVRHDGTSLALLLGLWLPAVVLGLVFTNEAQRARPGTGVTRPAGTGRRLMGSGLAAAALLAVVAALAAEFVRPPAHGGLTGRSADRFWDGVARSGRVPTSLGTYQSSDRLDVGRRFQLSDQVVMRVQAAAPDFWRGTSYDTWDGRNWTRTPLLNGVDDPWDLGSAGGVSAERQNLLQVFTVVAGGSDLLFGAYRAVQYVPPIGRPRTQADGTTTLAKPLGPGARYAVVSSRPVVDADLLRRADPLTMADGLPDAIRAQYLDAAALSRRALDLAHEVTSAEPTTYDKIKALERWIGDNTTYTLDIPPLPDGADAIDRFLFVDRRGFCEQIATSLAVMLRSVGVPARLGVGYAPGQRSWSSNQFVVRSRDAHAWVEVWFPGIGWQAFDPTAAVPLSGEPAPSPRARALPWLIGAGVAVVVVALLVILVGRVRRRRAVRWEEALFARVEDLGARRGRRRRSSETPVEYTRVLGEEVLDDPRLGEVGVVLSRAAYGAEAVDEGERQRIEQLMSEIVENAPPVPTRSLGRRGGGRIKEPARR
jgi:transglutaminase-like putative cysteine protease